MYSFNYKYFDSNFLYIIGLKYPIFYEHSLYFSKKNSITTVLIAITFFLVFNNLNIKANKLIDIFSSTTLGIYLIHDNNFIRPFIKKKII